LKGLTSCSINIPAANPIGGVADPDYIYVLYILMFALLRTTWINRFFIYTSLTYYWARYKAAGISLKDFKCA
jgi:hypothetical protein